MVSEFVIMDFSNVALLRVQHDFGAAEFYVHYLYFGHLMGLCLRHGLEGRYEWRDGELVMGERRSAYVNQSI